MFLFFLILALTARYRRGNFLICEVDMPVYANQSSMKVIPYRKVGERKFVHYFPGAPMLVDISRFLSQVIPCFLVCFFIHYGQVYPRTAKFSSSLVWEMDPDEFEAVTTIAKSRKTFPKNTLLPKSIIDSLVDPDDLEASLKPCTVRKQSKEIMQLQPLRAVCTTHLEPHVAFARSLVFSVLNAGAVNVRQARKQTSPIYGWDESLFMKVFQCFNISTHVTIRRNSPTISPVQPQSYEGAWANRRRREIQLILTAGNELDKWCAFDDFKATADRFYSNSGYKEISAKCVVEVVAIHTVDTRRSVGKQSKISVFVSTVFITPARKIEWSPLRWEGFHPIDDSDRIKSHILNWYDTVLLVERTPGRDSSVPSASSVSSVSMHTPTPSQNQFSSPSSRVLRSVSSRGSSLAAFLTPPLHDALDD